VEPASAHVAHTGAPDERCHDREHDRKPRRRDELENHEYNANDGTHVHRVWHPCRPEDSPTMASERMKLPPAKRDNGGTSSRDGDHEFRACAFGRDATAPTPGRRLLVPLVAFRPQGRQAAI
jgi:hypothetical protein